MRRAYMIRLDPDDLANKELVQKMAALTNLSPEQFKQRFEPVTRI